MAHEIGGGGAYNGFVFGLWEEIGVQRGDKFVKYRLVVTFLDLDERESDFLVMLIQDIVMLLGKGHVKIEPENSEIHVDTDKVGE